MKENFFNFYFKMMQDNELVAKMQMVQKIRKIAMNLEKDTSKFNLLPIDKGFVEKLELKQIHNDEQLKKLVGRFLYHSANELECGKQIDSSVVKIVSMLISNYQNKRVTKHDNDIIIGRFVQKTRLFEEHRNQVIYVYVDELIRKILLDMFSSDFESSTQSNKMLEIDPMILKFNLKKKGTINLTDLFTSIGLSIVNTTDKKDKLYLVSFVEYIIETKKQNFKTADVLDMIEKNMSKESKGHKEVIDADLARMLLNVDNSKLDNIKILLNNKTSEIQDESTYSYYLKSDELKQQLEMYGGGEIEKETFLSGKQSDIKVPISNYMNLEDVSEDDCMSNRIIQMLDLLAEKHYTANAAIQEYVKFVSFGIDNVVELLETNNCSYRGINNISSLMLLHAGAVFSNNRLFNNYVVHIKHAKKEFNVMLPNWITTYNNPSVPEAPQDETTESFMCMLQIIGHFALRRLGIQNGIQMRNIEYKEKVYLYDLISSAICARYYQSMFDENYFEFVDTVIDYVSEHMLKAIEAGEQRINLLDAVKPGSSILKMKKSDVFIINPVIRKYISMLYPLEVQIGNVFSTAQLNLYSMIPEHGFFENSEQHFDECVLANKLDISKMTLKTVVNANLEIQDKDYISDIIVAQMTSVDLKINSQSYQDNEFADKMSFLLCHLAKQASDEGVTELYSILDGKIKDHELLDIFNSGYISSDFHENIKLLSECDISQSDYNEYYQLISGNKMSYDVLQLMMSILEHRYNEISDILPIHCNFRFVSLHDKIDLSFYREVHVVKLDDVKSFCEMGDSEWVSIDSLLEFVKQNEYYLHNDIDETTIDVVDTKEETHIISDFIESKNMLDLHSLYQLANVARIMDKDDVITRLDNVLRLLENNKHLNIVATNVRECISNLI